MSRKIAAITHRVKQITVDSAFDQAPAAWLLAQAQTYGLATLLAHADDGVIWGKVDNSQLKLSGDMFPQVSPPLRVITLQQVRLFSPQAELHLWRDEQGWQARLVQDEPGAESRYYDEAQILWGNFHQPESTADFTLVADGEMGHRHAVPLGTSEAQFFRNPHPYRPLRLRVRHYLSHDDESGLLRVTLSRLVDLFTEEAP